MFKYANQIGYSDVSPYEVVRVVSENCYEVRAMEAVRSNPDADMGFCPGGFVGNFADQKKQEWDIQPNEDAPVFRIRASKARGKVGYFFDKWGNKYDMAAAPQRFYDYNF